MAAYLKGLIVILCVVVSPDAMYGGVQKRIERNGSWNVIQIWYYVFLEPWHLFSSLCGIGIFPRMPNWQLPCNSWQIWQSKLTKKHELEYKTQFTDTLEIIYSVKNILYILCGQI